MHLPIALVMLILFSMSILFNEAVGKINDVSEGQHPLAAVAVAVGVLYTILGAWMVDGDCMSIWTIAWAFLASGSPMIAGDILRWLERRK